MSQIPVREMVKNAIENLGGRATHKQIKNWVNEKYQNVNQNTLSTQINICTVNMPGRVGIPENDHPREFDSRYDFLYSVGRGDVVFYEPKIHGEWTIMNDENGNTVIAKDGVPISKSSTNDSSLEVFLKQKTLYRNYVPIIIKTLLESKGTTASIDEIKKNIDELNFDRSDYNFHDALRAAKGALEGFVIFSDTTISIHPDKLIPCNRDTCLKICGKRIAQYHIHELTKNNFEMWHSQPGRRDEDFPYLDEFLKTGSMGIAWNKTGSVLNLSREQIKEKFVQSYGGESSWQSVSHFLDIASKDIVVLTKGQEEIIDFGIVTGKYYWQDSDSYSHRKNVVWLNQGPISAQKLPEPKLSGHTAACGKVDAKKEMLIEILLGKETMAAFKAHSCFILSSYDDSEFADVFGKEYEYPKGQANSKSLIPGSKFIIQSKIDGKNYFVGYGKIDSIQQSEKTNSKGKSMHIAKFVNYEQIDPPELRTKEIYNVMKSMPEYGSQPPAILPITRQLYTKIIGQDLGEPDEIMTMSNVQKFVDILKTKKNVILYGPPGTGKTYTTTNIRKWYENNYINSGDSKKALLFSTDEGSKKIKKFQKFIEENKKILWGVGWHPVKLEESDYPITGYIKLKGQVIAIANIIQISRSDDTSESDTKLAAGGGGEPTYLHIDNLKLCTPFPFEKLNVFGKPDTDPNSQRFSYVELLAENVKFVTFHPSYSYEDFVEGIRPVIAGSNNGEKISDEKISYALEDGIFKKICKDATNDPDNDYLLIIDEINRGNVSKIFGELITLLEDDKRNKISLNLAYSKKPFTVPENLYILGTMNTADKSLVQIDTALRRRFAFVELMTNYDLPQLEFKINVKDKDGNSTKKSLKQLLEKLNEILRQKKLRDKQIGHSYFLNVTNAEDLKFVFKYEIIPLLQDYFFGELDKLSDVLGEKFISKDQMEINENVFEDSKFEEAIGQIFEK